MSDKDFTEMMPILKQKFDYETISFSEPIVKKNQKSNGKQDIEVSWEEKW